jgi:photosystem II stability/assembly factor-like uncharacterized protein
MTIETLVREANPAPLDTVPGPDSFEARRILLRLTSEERPAGSLHQGGPGKRRAALAALAVAALVVAAVVMPIVSHHSTNSRVPTATGTPLVHLGAWKLAGYITQPGVQVSSGSFQLSTSQQFTTQLACPSESTCYSDGTNVANVDQNSQSVLTVTRDGGATWNQVLSPGHGIYLWGITCPAVTSCMVAGAIPNSVASPSMYETTNGGSTWTSLPMPGADVSTIGLSCATTSRCVVLETVSVGPNPKAVSYFTSNGGHTWHSSSFPRSFFPSGTAGPDVQCFVNGHCIALGYQADDSHGHISGAVIYSTDSGATWTSSHLPPMESSFTAFGVFSCAGDEHCVSIESSQTSHGILATSGVLVTNDGGQTWNSFPTTDLTSTNPATPTSFDSISCATTTDCWASGQTDESVCQGSCAYVPAKGDLISTTDGGQTWTAVPLPAPPSPALQYGSVWPVSCVNGSGCFAVAALETTEAAAKAGTTIVNQEVVLTNDGSG